MPKHHPTSPKTVLGKVRLVLDQFTVERPQLTLTEIVRSSSLPKPTVFRLLQELTELGFVSQQGKRYRLGMASFRLGMVAKQQLGLDAILDDLLQPLAQQTGETIITAALDRGQVLYLHVIESKRPLRFVAGAGARRELPFGATSMALLCQLSPDELSRLLVEPFHPYTAKTITALDLYLERLQQAKRDSLVIERGEYYEGIMAIAVPIPNEKPLTFTVVGPEERVRPNQAVIVDQLREAAAKFAETGVEMPIA
ncbi:MAG: IclR family transcriptional regulator [Chloroflexota bacterium]